MEKKIMESGSNSHLDLKRNAVLRLVLITISAVITGILLSLFNLRIDLTEDQRYTLSSQTLRVLSDLRDDVYLQVYLDGEMPVQFKKMRRSVKNLLYEFRLLSGRRIGFDFINPAAGNDARQRNAVQKILIDKGLAPINVQAGDEEGGTTTRMIFPGMIVNYNGIEVPVNFLKNNPSLPAEQNLLNSIEGLEYEIIQTISTLMADTVHKVAIIEGHGEYSDIELADITLSLAKFFTIDRGVIGGRNGILDEYAAVIIAGPDKPFSEADKYVIDQYIMNGGKVLWLLEEARIDADSLDFGEALAAYRPLNLADQLFRYGARVNPVILQDMECARIPLKIIGPNEQLQVLPVLWPYYPLMVPSPNHPVTRNINRVKGSFVNSIDTVGLNPRVKKRYLLTTSAYTRAVVPPVFIALKEAERPPVAEEFTRSYVPVAVLLEGIFPSVFRNRMIPGITSGKDIIEESSYNRMIVVADGDIIKNETVISGNERVPLPLGYDRYTMQTYGNRDFIVNCMNWLVDESDLMELRSRELKLRLLDKAFVRKNIGMIRAVNIALPLVLLFVAGQVHAVMRRRKYGYGKT